MSTAACSTPRSFPTTAAGYRQLLGWLRSHGEVVAVGIEGTGSWGAGSWPASSASQGVEVREVMRPNRQHRRRHGKSDEADAIGAARTVLAGEALGTPKSQTGQVEAIRLLRVARRSAMKARTQAGNQIHAVVDTAPEQLRQRFVGRPTPAIVSEVALFRRRHQPDTPLEAARLALRTLARRWEYLNNELVELDAQLDELTAQAAPTLRAINGVGAQVATALLAAAGDNPDRLRSSSSFAALCGVSPIDASSGRQQHHRLNRYGDRHANWALHVIIISRLRWHPPTQTYMARRLAEGRTKKMVMRCLKRHVIREVHRAITTDLAPAQRLERSPAQPLAEPVRRRSPRPLPVTTTGSLSTRETPTTSRPPSRSVPTRQSTWWSARRHRP